MPLKYRTAGESHGRMEAVMVEGLPAGLEIDVDKINADLSRRQGGYGRGGRMAIEMDQIDILSGVRWGKTLGSPVLISILNRDWENWQKGMSPLAEHRSSIPPVTEARPGHVDLPGILKYGFNDARNVLERASARETAARVAAGAFAKLLLNHFKIEIDSFVSSIGAVEAKWDGDFSSLKARTRGGKLGMLDLAADERAAATIDDARRNGDSLGGSFVCFAENVPVGLGSYVSWTDKLDGRLGRAFLSIPAIKGVEIGNGFDGARLPGSKVHDEILPGGPEDLRRGGVKRATNRAGGIEGGVTNGEIIWVKAAMKPIPTLMSPLKTVDIATGEPVLASKERSDVCAVPAAAVVGEAALAFELAGVFLEKFGNDSLEDIESSFNAYLERIGVGLGGKSLKVLR